MSKLADFLFDWTVKVLGGILSSSTIYIFLDLIADRTLEPSASSTVAFPSLKIMLVPFFLSFDTDIRLDLSPGV